MPETVPTRLPLTYATLPRQYVPSLVSLLPARFAQCYPQLDPDFAAVTYGDAALGKRRQLSRLARDDWIVFSGGLAPSPPYYRPHLFAIGRLRVAAVHRLTARELGRADLSVLRAAWQGGILRQMPLLGCHRTVLKRTHLIKGFSAFAENGPFSESGQGYFHRQDGGVERYSVRATNRLRCLSRLAR